MSSRDHSPPLVSVLVPAFNHEAYVADAIRSVFAQTYRPLELIVIDDGSRDGTFAAIEEAVRDAPIPVRTNRQSNRGVSATLNTLFSLANGPLVAPLSSDDFFHPDRIRRCVERLLAAGPGYVLHGNAHLVESSGAIIGTALDGAAKPALGDTFDAMAEGRVQVVTPTIFGFKKTFEDAGGYDETMVAEDLDLHLRLARVAQFLFEEEPLAYLRHTPGSLGKRPWLWGDSIIRALEKHSDRLGPRLPVLLAKASENVAAACFEHGKPLVGLTWGRRALGYSPTAASRAATAGRVVARGLRGTGRFALVSLFGRERLVRFKRRLGR